MQTLVVCSGGLDSVTVAHKTAAEQAPIHLVSFDYVSDTGKSSNTHGSAHSGLG